MAFMMSIKDLILILNGLKWITMRSNNSHKIGREYQIKLNLFDEYAFKVIITSMECVDLNNMDDEDFYGIGYSKEDYLKHPYNLKNPSSKRYKYSFRVTEINERRLKEVGVI